MKRLLKQLFRFGIVGFIAFLIDYGLLYLFSEILHIHYLMSAALSFSVSVCFNYISSIKFVFDVGHKPKFKDVALFIILSVIGLGLNELIMYIGVDSLSVHHMIVKIFATAIVMIYNFITRKLLIEKKA